MSLKKETRKWTAQINHGGKKQHLGYFNDEQWGSVIISIVVPLRWPARRRGNECAPRQRVAEGELSHPYRPTTASQPYLPLLHP